MQRRNSWRQIGPTCREEKPPLPPSLPSQLPAHPPALPLVDDVACAFRGTATAGMIPRLGIIEAIVIGQLLPGYDVAQGHDPDPPANVLHLAIRGARMVDVPRGIPRHVAVDIIPR